MAGPTIPQSLSRRRPPPTGDEETSTVLRLGEMSDSHALSVSEANVILRKLMHRRRNDRPEPNTDVYLKTREYLESFARFKSEQAVQQVESVSAKLEVETAGLGEAGTVTGFERAQLATLCCDTVEEARTLVPSLEGKVSDDDLQQVLDDISKLRDFS